MKHSDQSTENDLDGDVSGTSFQAGSIEINVGAPGKRWRRKVLLYCSAPAVAAVLGGSAAVVDLVSPGDQVVDLPAAVTSTVPAQATTTSSPGPATGAPAPRRPTASAVRPTPPAAAPRANGNAPASLASPTTTTTPVSTVAAPPITTEGARYSGVLQFGSYHLDLPQPRDIAGTNVWPLTPGRLHGDPGYWLAEWITDGVPGRAECVARLAERSTQDAENLVQGSRVCGQTPEGRIFRIEVTALDSAGITGQVTVWELT
ncbi:hypothetical protein [Lentzea sp.]|uniref:hypothetical protein n=1 Tax=Lentzea sp. TaxID=56099 RepID=UPI002BE45E2A|nr:hypothetical protein [Lentzea sp.]HUQ61122.1 hypothetical protein [Lentzea sp.]